ncbi:hypothetical protein SAMD00023353_2801380 [Rosellinia necatrix]|uniref:F-box domain-containing protein n=1 Tax=Rosellinia necatrix TaxID=77044 RepID=A0A1W2TI34_ROSNE|nr:hypothetical protein SAMD00023353_2801380 [Rosellinia necatrix]
MQSPVRDRIQSLMDIDTQMMDQTHVTGQHSRPTLRDMLRLYPIHKCILDNLDMASLMNLCGTSWGLRTDIYSSRWDINRKLERFFRDPRAFRTELGRADALISGSFALQFFANKFWPESDLDINLHGSERAERLGEYLVRAEGYEMVAAPVRFYDDSDIRTLDDIRMRSDRRRDICNVITYVRPTHDDDDGDDGNGSSTTGQCKVQLITTKHHPVQAILSGYYTTCIVNFITWNKAYCIFPRATLLFNETVPLTRQADCNVKLHKKYSLRGWRVRTALMAHDAERVDVTRTGPKGQNRYMVHPDPLGHGSFRDRRIGGGDTWTMRLGTAGVRPPPQPDSVIECSGFTIIRPNQRDDQDGLGFSITASPFVSHSLRYLYTYGSMTQAWQYVGDVLSCNTLGQINTKMMRRESEHLVEDTRVSLLFTQEFEKPDGWDYWDDWFPEALDREREELGNTY